MSGTGRFLVLEGIDGSGKTSQIQNLARWLPESGLMPPDARLLVTREPGGTELGQALRSLLLHPPGTAAPCGTAELLLYAADRAQHVREVLRPELAAGSWILCDRFSGSTAAYQGFGRGLDLQWIADLETIAIDGLTVDLTLWLDLPLELSLQRRGDRVADRMEATGGAFLENVCQGFATLARERCWQRIDASQPPKEVLASCQRHIRERLGGGPGDPVVPGDG